MIIKNFEAVKSTIKTTFCAGCDSQITTQLEITNDSTFCCGDTVYSTKLGIY